MSFYILQNPFFQGESQGVYNTSALTPLNRVLSHARPLGEARHGQAETRREAADERDVLLREAGELPLELAGHLEVVAADKLLALLFH